MAVEDPGCLTITCDICGNNTAEVPTCELVGKPSSFTVDLTALPEGWLFDTEGCFVCPDPSCES